MNSQCNGSFLPKWQETRAGTDALPYTVCFCCPVFWVSGQIGPKKPTLAHVGRTGIRGTVLRPRGLSQRAPNLRVPSKTQDLRRFYDDQAVSR